MTLDYWEGFDEWQTSDAGLFGWSSDPNSLETGRFGGQCARWRSNSTASRGLPVSGNRVTVGFAWRTGSAGHVYAALLDLMEGGTVHGRLAYNGDGTFTVSRNNALVGANPTTPNLGIAANTWYYLELDYYCANSGGTYELRVNGVTQASGTGDTQNGGTGVMNTLMVRTPSGITTHDWDDLYVASGATSFQGDCRVITSMPNSDGTYADWAPSTGTDHYAVVDEVPQNGDTDYVSDGTVGDRDTYGFPALGVTGTVLGVMVQAMARKDDAGVRSLGLVVKSGTTTSDGAGVALSSTYAPVQRYLLTDPDTGSAWTVAGVNAAECGQKVVA